MYHLLRRPSGTLAAPIEQLLMALALEAEDSDTDSASDEGSFQLSLTDALGILGVMKDVAVPHSSAPVVPHAAAPSKNPNAAAVNIGVHSDHEAPAGSSSHPEPRGEPRLDSVLHLNSNPTPDNDVKGERWTRCARSAEMEVRWIQSTCGGYMTCVFRSFLGRV